MTNTIDDRDLTILAAQYWPQTHGGVEQHMWQFSRELARAGVRVNVLTEKRTTSPSHETIMPDLDVERQGPIDPGRLWRWMPLVRLHWWTRWLRSYDRPGLIWASNPMLATASILAGHGNRTIFNPAGCANAMRHIGRLYPQITTMQLPMSTAWMDRFAYRNSRRTVVASRNIAQQFVLAHGERDNLDVVPLCVEIPDNVPDPTAARRQWGIDSDAFVVGFVGRLDPCKGLDFLFDALCQSHPAPTTRLLIAGNGPDEARLRRRARDAGLTQHIVWAGRLADPAPAYAAMDTLVLPSIYEGFGLVLLEAMAAGTCVLGRVGNSSTILTACDEIIDHGQTGLLFDSHDPADLAQQLRQLEAHPQLRRSIGAQACCDVNERTWRHYTQHCLKILNRQWHREPSNACSHRRHRQAA